MLQGCLLTADFLVSPCNVSQGRDFLRNTSIQKKKKISMIYDSNVFFADANASAFDSKREKPERIDKESKSGQFIV